MTRINYANRHYIGCDPGSTGAIALIYGDTATAWDIPLASAPRGGIVVDDAALLALVQSLVGLGPAAVALEMTWGIRGQGGASQYKFGDTAAAIRMAFVASGCPPHMIAAQRWKTRLRVHGGKDVSIAKALDLYPDAAPLLTPRRKAVTQKQAEGRADAILIAHYARVMQL